eukprot:3739012-Rhodomonas_salina.1
MLPSKRQRTPTNRLPPSYDKFKRSPGRRRDWGNGKSPLRVIKYENTALGYGLCASTDIGNRDFLARYGGEPMGAAELDATAAPGNGYIMQTSEKFFLDGAAAAREA